MIYLKFIRFSLLYSFTWLLDHKNQVTLEAKYKTGCSNLCSRMSNLQMTGHEMWVTVNKDQKISSQHIVTPVSSGSRSTVTCGDKTSATQVWLPTLTLKTECVSVSHASSFLQLQYTEFKCFGVLFHSFLYGSVVEISAYRSYLPMCFPPPDMSQAKVNGCRYSVQDPPTLVLCNANHVSLIKHELIKTSFIGIQEYTKYPCNRWVSVFY